jgi:SAM-dependent methyltransferase
VLDTFYYFRDPLLELEEFRRILKPDGLLAVEVPLAGPRLWRLTSRLGKWFSLEKDSFFKKNDHLYFYGLESLSRIINQSKFRILGMIPLISNRQSTRMKDAPYLLYSEISRALWKLSGARVMLGPRLLVIARPQ